MLGFFISTNYFLAVVPQKLLVNIMGPNFIKDNRVVSIKFKDDSIRVIHRKAHKPVLRSVEFVGFEPRVVRIFAEYRFPLFGTSLYFFGQLFVLPSKLRRVMYLHTL